MSAKKTHAQYVAEVQAKHAGKIEVLDKYVNALTHLNHQCKVCGHVWPAKPPSIACTGSGCPQCVVARAKASAGHTKRKATSAEKQKAADLASQGLSYTEIGKLLNRDGKTVSRWLDNDLRLRDVARAKKRTQKVYEERRAVKKAYNQSPRGAAINRSYWATRKRDLEGEYIALSQLERTKVNELYEERDRLNDAAGCIAFHIDHIMPVALGGVHALFNLRIITAEENLRKNAKYTAADQALYLARIMEIFREG